MGNICSIFHAHFDKLVELTRNHKKAVFLDKCLYWWQLSNYTLGDNQIWFTRSITKMAQEISLSERTVSRYLQELVEKGMLERCCKLSASNKGQQFKVTKRLYIRVTEKLLQYLQTHSLKNKSPKHKEPGMDKNNRSYLHQNGEIEKANLAESINKDQDHKSLVNNTVNQINFVENKKKSDKHKTIFPQYAIEKLIGERLDERTKNYIKSTMINLQKQHDVHFSKPEQTFAEIVFSVTNHAQLKKVETLTHKIQIIAKLIREKRWLTPKGFYNHADYGHYFKLREGSKAPNLIENSVKESQNSSYQVNHLLKQKKAQLKEIESLCFSEERYLKEVLADSKQGLDRTLLLQSIQKKRQGLEAELNLLGSEINSLEQVLMPGFQQGENLCLQQTHHLNSFIEQAEQLRLQRSFQFEIFCQTMRSLPKGHSEIDKEYENYQQLNEQLELIENYIADLEYKLYTHDAA